MKLLIPPKLQWLCYPIPKLQLVCCWSFGMAKYFHPTLYNGCNYSSMLGLKFIHVCNMSPRAVLALQSLMIITVITFSVCFDSQSVGQPVCFLFFSETILYLVWILQSLLMMHLSFHCHAWYFVSTAHLVYVKVNIGMIIRNNIMIIWHLWTTWTQLSAVPK